MKVFNDDPQNYYKRMLDLQEKLRKSEEERIRLEERFNILVQDSRNRHQTCVNRLRIRYVEFLEEQRARDERNNKLLGTLEKVDNSLALMTAKTERLNVLRKHYEAYLLRVYGNQRAAGGSTTVDSGLESQTEPKLSFNSTLFRFGPRSTPNSLFSSRTDDVLRANSETFNPSQENILKPNKAQKASEARQNFHLNYSLPMTSSPILQDDVPQVRRIYFSPSNYSSAWTYGESPKEKPKRLSEDSFYDLLNKSPESSGRLSSAHDLDSYIGKIRRLHAETIEREKQQSALELDRSLEEHEQNTSGDLLNVTLSEEIDRPVVAQEPTKRPTSAAGLQENTRKPQSIYGSYNQDKLLGSSTTRPVVQPKQQLATGLGLASVTERPIEMQPRQEQQTELEETEDGIEDDYDDSVDIDSWMPDDREPEDDEADQLQQKLQEMRLHERPRRKLEAIEEVEQVEDDAPLVDNAEDVQLPPDQTSVNNSQELQAELPKESSVAEAQPEQVNYEGEKQAVEEQEQYYQQQEDPYAQQIYNQQDNNNEQQQVMEQQGNEADMYAQEQYPEQYIAEAGHEQAGYAYDAAGYQYDGAYENQEQQQQDPQQGYYDQQYAAEYMNMEGQYQEGYDANQAAAYPSEPGQETQADYQYQYYDEQYQAGQGANQTEPVTQAEGAAEQPGQEYGYEQQPEEATSEQPSLETKPNSRADESGQQEEEGGQQQQAAVGNAGGEAKRSKEHAKPSEAGPKKKKDVIKSILDSDSESLIEHKLSNSESDFDFN